ncbi:MAG: hypothetical protein Q8O63_09450, partial [Hoeflea sp.]|nr:hypothetical protein [Hoeflea sp.]
DTDTAVRKVIDTGNGDDLGGQDGDDQRHKKVKPKTPCLAARFGKVRSRFVGFVLHLGRFAINTAFPIWITLRRDNSTQSGSPSLFLAL